MTPYISISSSGLVYQPDGPERMLPSGSGIRIDRRPPSRRRGRKN